MISAAKTCPPWRTCPPRRGGHLAPRPPQAGLFNPGPSFEPGAVSSFPLLPSLPLPPLLPPLTPLSPSFASAANRNTFSNKILRITLKANKRASSKSQQNATFLSSSLGVPMNPEDPSALVCRHVPRFLFATQSLSCAVRCFVSITSTPFRRRECLTNRGGV
jgi:hypothetical protein